MSITGEVRGKLLAATLDLRKPIESRPCVLLAAAAILSGAFDRQADRVDRLVDCSGQVQPVRAGGRGNALGQL